MEIVLYKPVIRSQVSRPWAGLELGSEVETLVFKLMGKLDDKE